MRRHAPARSAYAILSISPYIFANVLFTIDASDLEKKLVYVDGHPLSQSRCIC